MLALTEIVIARGNQCDGDLEDIAIIIQLKIVGSSICSNVVCIVMMVKGWTVVVKY